MTRLFPPLLLLIALSPLRAEEQNCGISLGELARTGAAQGEELQLYGDWGETRGRKAPCLNKGGCNELPVLSWSPEVIKLQIPPDLPPGSYKLGVYCAMGKDSMGYSTDWVDFKVTKAEKDSTVRTKTENKPPTPAAPVPVLEPESAGTAPEPEPAAAGPQVHCGIALHRPELLAAAPGDILELGGYWGKSKGNKTPFLLGKATNILTVVSWSSETIKVRIPPYLPLGRYKLGVYCDKPGRGLGLATFVFDFDLLEKGNPKLKPKPAGKPRRQENSAPNLRLWVTSHPKLREALIWEGSRGAENFFEWPEDRKAALDKYFQLAWSGKPYGLPDPPANSLKLLDEHTVEQTLSPEDALDLYLATLAQSLALEAGGHLPWRLEDTSPEDIAMVLSGKEMFTLTPQGTYRVDGGKSGFILPPPPDAGYAFMQDKVGRSRFETIAALLEWIAGNVIHVWGELKAKNIEAQFGYRGYPPATRTIKGTYHHPEGSSYSFSHRTAGCIGTAGFLRAILRCVNIPVRVIGVCDLHTSVFFPTEKRYLSHGDDPYSRTDGWGTPCAAAKLLIDEATFRSWFGKGVSREECDKNIGRGAREILSKPCPKR